MSINSISVVMIAKNAQDSIKESLDSLTGFEEVILYLNNSDDETKIIAQNYKNVKIVEGEFLGFGPTKNRAATFAKNEWIFSLDSDEIVTKSLFKELELLSLDDENDVFIIKRDNYFLGKKIKYSGWGKDFLVRIYNKNIHSFNSQMVHEKVQLRESSKKIALKNSFTHLAIVDISQFLTKISRYSKLAAGEKKSCSFIVVLLKSTFAFIKTYFFRLGILDGYRGFVIAISDANGRFYRYLQRYINCKK